MDASNILRERERYLDHFDVDVDAHEDDDDDENLVRLK